MRSTRSSYKVSIHLLGSWLIILTLVGCSSARFYQIESSLPTVTQTDADVVVEDLSILSSSEVHERCLSYDENLDVELVLLLRCSHELLTREYLAPSVKNFAITKYNFTLSSLAKIKKIAHKSISLEINGPSEFILAAEMQTTTKRLQPEIFGLLGVPVVVKRNNRRDEIDQYYPLEGIFKSYSILLDRIAFDAER